MNSKGHPLPRRNPSVIPPFVPGPSGNLVSINESQEDQVSVEQDSPQLRDFLFGSDLSPAGIGQLLRAQMITDPKDREALVKRIAWYQWWAPHDRNSEHVLRATLLKFGLSTLMSNQILMRQALTQQSDRVALLVFINKLVPKKAPGVRTHGAKSRGRK